MKIKLDLAITHTQAKRLSERFQLAADKAVLAASMYKATDERDKACEQAALAYTLSTLAAALRREG